MKHLRALDLPLFALVALVAAMVFTGDPGPRDAHAETPTPVNRAEQYMRLPLRGKGVVVAATTAWLPVTTVSGAATGTRENLWCLAYESGVRVSCAGAVDVLYSQVPAITDTSGTPTDVSGDSTDNNRFGLASGDALQARVEAGTYLEDIIPRRPFLSDTKGYVGVRTGYCSGNATTTNWPCGVDADCGTSGTCNDQTSRRGAKCAFVLVKAVSSATSCMVSNPR